MTRAIETPTPTPAKQRTTPTKRVASPSPSKETGSSSGQRTRSNSGTRKPDPPTEVPSSTTVETPKKRSRAETPRTVRESSQVVDIDNSSSSEDVSAARPPATRDSSNVPILNWFKV